MADSAHCFDPRIKITTRRLLLLRPLNKGLFIANAHGRSGSQRHASALHCAGCARVRMARSSTLAITHRIELLMPVHGKSSPVGVSRGQHDEQAIQVRIYKYVLC